MNLLGKKFNLKKAEATIGVDEGAMLLAVTNKIEKQPLKRINLAKATLGKKHIKLHHLLQWDQKYKRLPL